MEDTIRPFTRQRNLGPYHSKKRYRPITFVKKHWSFYRAIGAYGPAETPVFLYKSYGSVPLFEGSRPKFFCHVNGLYVSAFQLDYYNDSISGYEVLPRFVGGMYNWHKKC